MFLFELTYTFKHYFICRYARKKNVILIEIVDVELDNLQLTRHVIVLNHLLWSQHTLWFAIYISIQENKIKRFFHLSCSWFRSFQSCFKIKYESKMFPKDCVTTFFIIKWNILVFVIVIESKICLIFVIVIERYCQHLAAAWAYHHRSSRSTVWSIFNGPLSLNLNESSTPPIKNYPNCRPVRTVKFAPWSNTA